jgi:4,5-dihydroxyphthalate decarboxylase
MNFDCRVDNLPSDAVEQRKINMNIPLSLAMADYDRTAALRDGSVKPAGIDLTYIVSAPSETFWRMLKFEEFDAAEMSLSSFFIARSQARAWTAIPVFPFRALFHTYVFVRSASGIRRPSDLAGARFGLPEYQMTAAVWMRGVLQEDFGVSPSTIHWFVERSREMSHGGQTSFRAPEGVSVELVPEGRTLLELLERGEIDAVMASPYPAMTSMLNRTRLTDLTRSPHVRLLFEDPLAESVRFVRQHGFSHINHTLVVQNRVLERHPWVALNLFNAFVQANQAARAKTDALFHSSLMAAFGVIEMQRRAFGDDPFPYGLRENRAALETLARYELQQGLVPAAVTIDDLFAATTRQV